MKLLTFFTFGTAAVAMAAEPTLQKRFKEKIVAEGYRKQQEALSSSSTSVTQTPWVRTITVDSSEHVEIITPTVIAGVTFSAKPPKTTDGLEPWISLNKDGSPKTIKPQLKNGRTKNASPTYGTYFATATTVTYNKEQLKAHNMAEDEIFTEVQYVDEDPLEHSLNPLMRCTPNSYSKKGVGKDKSTEPFCFPRDNSVLKVDKSYFITWYSRFFEEDVQNVRVHLSHVKEAPMQKGWKRDNVEESVEKKGILPFLISLPSFMKRSSVIEQGGSIESASFYISDWLPKSTGYLPVTILREWTSSEYYKKVLISIQPDNVEDEDFDHLANSIVVEFAQGAKVSKEYMEDLKKLDAKYAGEYEVIPGPDYEKYYIIMGMPTAVALAALLMYFFVWANKGQTDLSHLKKKRFARGNTTRKMLSFKKKEPTLPQYELKGE